MTFETLVLCYDELENLVFPDHAETRRGKPSVNRRWDITRSAMCGDYILAVAAKVLAQIRNEDVLIVLAQVLADLVRGKLSINDSIKCQIELK
jgi:geranylgeranyl pyrophosphate synthase